MSSDSGDPSTPANLPADARIEQCLRRTVRDAIQAGEEITINLARARAEEQLALDKGFLKEHDLWKKKSKDIISAAVEEPESPETPQEAHSQAGMKRKSAEIQTKRKRVKRSAVPDSDAADDRDGKDEESPHSEVAARKEQPKSEEESAPSDPPADESEPAALKQNGKASEQQEVDDDSDLSSVIDNAPPKKNRQKKSTSPSATKPKPRPRANSKAKPSKPDNPSTGLSSDDEEIKRLQSWLLKCGVRKLWHRELAPYTTPKDKIKHLKAMLGDVGMTGRFSADKARSIKESRELAAELEAAKEFNEQWGHDEGTGSEGGGKKEEEVATRRLKPKGLVDFGDSGEDSD